MKNRKIHVPFFWGIMSTLLVTVLIYLLTRSILITLMVGLADLGIKGLVFAVFRARQKRKSAHGFRPAVIWLTGLPGAGKTTLGKALSEELNKMGYPVEHLDGDNIREMFPQTGFTREERDRHIKSVGFMASRLEFHGVFVVASFISPYADAREFVRNLCIRFTEVHVSTPLEVCEQRDPKGLYARARRGEIPRFTGVNDPYEIPANPALRIDTSILDVQEAVKRMIDCL